MDDMLLGLLTKISVRTGVGDSPLGLCLAVRMSRVDFDRLLSAAAQRVLVMARSHPEDVETYAHLVDRLFRFESRDTDVGPEFYWPGEPWRDTHPDNTV
jgi:hypothetical protein